MITAYRSDIIRAQHSEEYDRDRAVLGSLADTITCPNCQVSYSLFFHALAFDRAALCANGHTETRKHDPALIRQWGERIAQFEHPGHSSTCIRIPEDQGEAKDLGIGSQTEK